MFGSLSPSSSTGKVLLIRTFSEWNSITIPATLDHFLGQGLGPLLMSRLGGLVAAITIYAVMVGGVILVPFMLIGGWLRRRSPDFSPAFGYAGILFAFNALIFAVHVPGGTFIHSAIGLAPHSYVLVMEGLAASVGWVATRRRGWDREQATRIFSGAVVAFAIVAAIAGSLTTHATWASRVADHQFAAAALDAAGAPLTDRVMSIDASGTKYWSGRGGVVLVNDPLPTVEQVATRLPDPLADPGAIRRRARRRADPRRGRQAGVDRAADRLAARGRRPGETRAAARRGGRGRLPRVRHAG